MKDLISRLEEKKMSYDSQAMVVKKNLQNAMSDLKRAVDDYDSADAVVFNVASALSNLGSAVVSVSKGHGGKLHQMAGLVKGAASDLSTKGRDIVKGK